MIAVNNLDSAIIEYERYGFTVVYGGAAKKAFNALIFLRDGTAIELIGKDRLPYPYTFLNKLRITNLFGMMKDRIAAFRNIPPGLFNYCLYTENLNSTYKYLKQLDLRVAKPVSFSRLRDDMVKIKWELIGTYPYDLPFFIGAYTPARLSDATSALHKNKAIAIDSIIIATNSFDKYYQTYNIIYNQIPIVQMNNNKRFSIYKLGSQFVVLQEATEIHSFFTKKDQSYPVRFSIKCERDSCIKTDRLNNFIMLTP